MSELEPTRPVTPVPGEATSPAAPAPAPEGAGLTDLPGPSPAVVQPVVGSGAAPIGGGPARPRGLLRWGVALVVVALLVGVVSVGAALLAGSGASSVLTAWIPSNTLAYAEFRADMPGDQKAKVGALLARFPGFKDQASLDQKLDEALDRMTEKSGVTFTKDIKPWLTGEMAFVMTPGMLEASQRMSAVGLGGSSPTTPITDGAAYLASVRDPAAAEALIRSKAPDMPAATQYNGFNLTTLPSTYESVSFATGSNLLVIGLTDTVKAVIDTKGASAVAKSSAFSDAHKVAPASYLAFMYMDMKAYWSTALASLGSTPNPGLEMMGLDSASLMKCVTKDAEARLPAWEAGFVQARDDAAWLEMRAPLPAGTSTPAATSGTLARHLPAGTVFAATVRNLGPTVVTGWKQLVAVYSCDEKLKANLEQVDKALATVGGLDGLIGWAGDSAIVVTRTEGSFGGGIASVATDPAAAQKAFNQLQALVSLGGQAMGLSSEASQYAGAEMVTITLPAAANTPPLAFAIRDGLFALGTADFVRATLDTTDATAMAAQPRFKRAQGMLGDKAVMELYVDITGIREASEALMSADTRSRYDTEIKPFLEGFESFYSSTTVDGGQEIVRAVAVFK